MSFILRLVNKTTLPDGGPVSFQLRGKRPVGIGRAADLDWTLPDPSKVISNTHCEIRYQDGGYWLHDVSTNGTFVNGADLRMQAPHRLRNGDRFTVGNYLVTVTPEDTKAADFPAQPRSNPASSYEVKANDWASSPPLPRPPPPAGVEDSLFGAVAFALQGGAAAPHLVAGTPKEGPARLGSLPARMTPASTAPKLGVQARALSRRGNSASSTKTTDEVRATKAWMARQIESLRSGRTISRLIISGFGAAFLMTAVWFTAFFLRSSEKPSPATTKMAAAVLHPRLSPQTFDTPQADPPSFLLPLPSGPNSPELVASGSAVPVEPEPLFPASIQSLPLDQSALPDQGRLSDKSAPATHNFSTDSAEAIFNEPRPVPIFEGSEATYWRLINEKRRLRGAKHRDNQQVALEDYVLAQPPRQSWRSPGEESTRSAEYIPVAADFLKAAAKEFNFVPERPATEMEFKKAYVRLALSAGLTKDQIVRIYAFETGGNGTYDTQAGLEFHRPGERAVSAAMGYNQLLATNSVELLSVNGDSYLQELSRIADNLTGSRKEAMLQKIEALRRMVAFSRTVPNVWQEHERLARTTEGGRGIHALMFDRDIGPMLQTQKLFDSLLYARKKGYTRPLTAAELELMNLTGDGNGFDMILMPAALRVQVTTANFFQQEGYERNAIARRAVTVVGLLATIDAEMDKNSRLPGARELAGAF